MACNAGMAGMVQSNSLLCAVIAITGIACLACRLLVKIWNRVISHFTDDDLQHFLEGFWVTNENESWIHMYSLTSFTPDDINFDNISESIHISIAEAAEHVRL